MKYIVNDQKQATRERKQLQTHNPQLLNVDLGDLPQLFMDLTFRYCKSNGHDNIEAIRPHDLYLANIIFYYPLLRLNP